MPSSYAFTDPVFKGKNGVIVSGTANVATFPGSIGSLGSEDATSNTFVIDAAGTGTVNMDGAAGTYTVIVELDVALKCYEVTSS